MHTRSDLFIVRLLRTSVIALGAAVPLSGHVLERLSDSHRVVASTALWILWAVMLLAILVPASSALTALRLAAPAHLATSSMVSAVAGADAGSIISLAVSAIVVALVASAETGAYFIQSSAYGDERRFPLRCPRSFLVVIVLAWILWFGAAATGAILIASGLVVGTAFALAGLAGFVFLPRRFHRYARRWLVQVPAGLVVHDHVVLTETSMFPRRAVAAVEPWSRADSPDNEPFDLSGGVRTSGISIRLSGPETVILAPTREHPGGQAFHVRSVRLCPTRVARALSSLGGLR